MLKKQILMLKNISHTRLMKSRLELDKMHVQYKICISKLKKILVSYNIYKKTMYNNMRLGIDIIQLRIYYKNLLSCEKKILFLKSEILKYKNNIENAQMFFQINYKKLKIWDILYNRILFLQRYYKKKLSRKYYNQYYQIFSLKKIINLRML
ncbi:Flagellar FliJ protein [Buchnera aphidicola (Takecallis arundicolens)]|uniref:hypothetical protein n=1 Tax=Buchnera aphidicola TaxID=9 RepID=UPI003464280D